MEINGLPLHPLVVHAAVVFAPLAALAALLYVVVPRWRDRLRWPLLVLAVVATGVIVVAYFTGENFLDHKPELEGSLAVEKHEHRGQQLLYVGIGFGVVALVAAWLHARRGALRVVLDVLLAAAGVVLLVWVFLAGEAGARAVWG
jgi:uncharacterized membrane protein